MPPFPWKKKVMKSTRICRLLNDHLHNSQKRRDGSSLVVETGFPTSLIDLFIKNREKLKNPSKKKRETSLSVPSLQAGVDDPVIAAGSPRLLSPSRLNSQVIAGLPLNCSSPLRRSASLLRLPLGVNEIDVGDRDGGGAESKCGIERVVDAKKGVILVAVKIFLVAVLALGTKRLAVGITMSAFFLCFLECAAKHLRELLKPCSKARGWLISVVQKVPKLRYNDGASLWKVRQEARFQRPDPSLNGMHQTQMIEIEKEIMEDSFFMGGSRRNRETDESNNVVAMVIGKEKSLFGVETLNRKPRKDKIKSKMKLFIPKKFWSLRKDHNFSRLKIVQEDKVAVCEEQGMDECEDEYWESESTASRISSTSSGRFKEEVMNSIYFVGGLPEIDDEEVATNKEAKSGMSWINLVPCLTVLMGLIGGRSVALLLTTLSWFLVLKFGKTLPIYVRTAREVPLIKSFDDR